MAALTTSPLFVSAAVINLREISATAGTDSPVRREEKRRVIDGHAVSDWYEWKHAGRRYRFEADFRSDAGDPTFHAKRFCDAWNNEDGHDVRNARYPECWPGEDNKSHITADITVDDVFDDWRQYSAWVHQAKQEFQALKMTGLNCEDKVNV